MEHIFTTTAGVITPAPEENCPADIFCGTFNHAVFQPEELPVVDLVRMVSALNHSISRPNKINPAEYHFYCGIMDA